MERIELDDVNNAAKREKLFVREAARLLSQMEYRAVGPEHRGELARSDKEMRRTEESKQRIIDEWSAKVSESRISKRIKEEGDSGDSLDAEAYAEKILTAKERRAKNKRRYPPGLTKGKRMKAKRRRYRRRH
jgi:hypothetical protein